jgi:hypothetical protein
MPKGIITFTTVFLICLSHSFLAAALPVTDGLVMHLDAGQIIATDGDPITTWPDVSGVANDATQATAGAQPTYVASNEAYNGHASVQFDGTDDWMDLNESAVNIGNFMMFVLGKFDRSDGNNMYFMSAQNGAGSDRLRIASYNGNIQSRIGTVGDFTLITGRDTGTHAYAVNSIPNAWVDGGKISGGTNTFSGSPDDNGFVLGCYGIGTVQKDFLQGSIAEVILYNRVLTEEEINWVGYYFSDKYNLDISYSVPSAVSNPVPGDGSVNVSPNTLLKWDVSPDIIPPVFDIYLDTDSNGLQFVSVGQSSTEYDPLGSNPLPYGQKVQWRVDVQGVPEPGPVWSFTTHTEPLISLSADLNLDGVVDINDLGKLALQWLSASSGLTDIESDGTVNLKDYARLSSEYKKEAALPSSYVITEGGSADFTLFDDGVAAAIVTEQNDFTVCHIAADLLADDIKRVCGTKPQQVQDTSGLAGNAVFVATLGKSSLVDSLVAEGKLDVSDVTGQWETFILQVINEPIAGIDKGLFIVGSDRRGTAFGVFDLSEKIGVSPWYWWADVPVRHRDTIVVRNERYKDGPPSVKYRGIFINDEDWGMHPWARDTYAPEDGYIGPKTYQQVFELLLRLKANYLWPAMHDCTKAFNAFEENKVIADDYGIVMGSSHCEQMLRNNQWEWTIENWQPSDGSARGDWDWCTNSAQITEYWDQRVKINAPYESIYTMGMRGIHDSGMPCSGATNADKVQKMQNEIFPAQRQMLASWVNPDPSKVAQIFCPYKEVLDLYNMGLEVPDDITLVWPDDNHGYIRHLSTSAEQTRSGKAGVYYHLSYWGSPANYLWLNSIPLSLIWEEMKKAYDYQNSRVWIVNVGDLKPAEMGMEFFLDMGWDIDRWNKDSQADYIEHWAWREFGPTYRKQISGIMLEYYRLGLAKKPEHLNSSGIGFSMINYGDEMQQRIDQYAQIESQAASIYESLGDPYKDAFYQLVLYPVRCAALINKKIFYAEKSNQYAVQGRVSANHYATMTQSAYDQIITETDFYNNTMSDGKWKGMMDWQPQGLSVFGLPSTSSVTPVSGPSMGVVVEGQTSDITTAPQTLPPPFSDDFSDGNADGWNPYTASRWEIRPNGPRMEYAINTSDYSNQSGDRLGELSFMNAPVVDNFRLTCLARSTDNFGTNGSADLAIVFGYIDSQNYNYMIFSSAEVNSSLHRIINGSRMTVQTANYAIPDNDFHQIEIEKKSSALTVKYDGNPVITVNEAFTAGLVGVGSYNDSAAFTEINVTPLASDSENLPEFDVFTRQSYFVDIFNKGDTSFTWTAVPSKSWIQIDQTNGTVTGEQRLWVSIDWAQAPLGTLQENIEISGAGQSVTVDVEVFNPASPRPADLDGFVQSNGYVSMEAEHFSDKVLGGSGAAWEVVPRLGRTGDSMMVFPVTTLGTTEISQIVSQSPRLEYEVYLWDMGQQPVTVYCLPTHAINPEHGLRYAVAFDDQTPQIVEYDEAEYTAPWSANVLRGAAITQSTHTVTAEGSHVLKIWMVDPGVVIDKIVIGNAPTSHLGPPETTVR